MLLCTTSLLLAAAAGVRAVAIVNSSYPFIGRDLHPRAAVNGSCLSAPDDSCLALLGICISSITSGEVPSNAFWSDRVCTAAATCAGTGAVLNAACCAGTCMQPININSIDYNNIYTGIVGDCASQPGGCSMTWQPFIDWFYNTIQGTGTNLYPDSGDDVLGWWADIATWTALCEGTNCIDSAIPYTNFNDWFHFSSAVDVTTPGTPQYTDPLSTDPTVNDDNWTPDFSWPCAFDDEDDCWWDYGPPTPPEPGVNAISANARPRLSPFNSNGGHSLAGFRLPVGANFSPVAPYPFGRAEHQPANVPPPVYVMGKRLTLNLSETDDVVGLDLESLSIADDSEPTVVKDTSLTPPYDPADFEPSRILSAAFTKITPEACVGPTDTPAVLPSLAYYCNLLPNICDNIRSHPDFGVPTPDTIVLTYDPFSASTGRRRRGVCTTATKNKFQAEGKCDAEQHNPAFWKVSCDEFPFNSALEGGANNAVTLGVPMREQQYQGTLQSSITNLRRVASNGKTVWKGSTGRMCHKYILRLLPNPELNAPPNAVGSLFAGSAFFGNSISGSNTGTRFITDRRALLPMPDECSHGYDYLPTDRSLRVPSYSKGFDCRPCNIGSTGSPTCTDPFTRTLPGREVHPGSEARNSSVRRADHADLAKRQAAPSACPTSISAMPSSTAAAAAIAKSAAATAAAAAAAASAAVVNVPAAASAAAAAAVAAADSLTSAADALSNPTNDAAWASAFAMAESSVELASDALSPLLNFLTGEPDDPVQTVVDNVSTSSNSVSSSMDAAKDVMNPTVPIPPDVDPAKNPALNKPPPTGIPPAACFGAGSKGFVMIGDIVVGDPNNNQHVPATLVDAGSDAFFGLDLPNVYAVKQLDGCTGVYGWYNGPAQPDFQVDCSTNEFGTYWSAVKQACYAYGDLSGTFYVICGNNLGNVYSCLAGAGLPGARLTPIFMSWRSS